MPQIRFDDYPDCWIVFEELPNKKCAEVAISRTMLKELMRKEPKYKDDGIMKQVRPYTKEERDTLILELATPRLTYLIEIYK